MPILPTLPTQLVAPLFFQYGERLIIVTRRYQKNDWNMLTHTMVLFDACDAIWIEPSHSTNELLGRSLVSGMRWDDVKDLPEMRLVAREEY